MMTALMNNSLGGYDVCIGVCVSVSYDEVESQRQEEMTGCSSHCHTRHRLASFTAIAIRCSGINQHSLNRSQFV